MGRNVGVKNRTELVEESGRTTFGGLAGEAVGLALRFGDADRDSLIGVSDLE